MKERWKNILEYKGIYQVSNFGRIKRLIGKGCKKERILKFNKKSKYGHLQVDLSKNGKRKKHLVHRLVLENFVGLCSLRMECRHLDSNPQNNKLENLCWGTRSENQIDRKNNGTKSNPIWLLRKGSEQPNSKLKNNDIFKIRKLHLKGKSNIEISKLLNISRQTISDIINYRTWKHI